MTNERNHERAMRDAGVDRYEKMLDEAVLRQREFDNQATHSLIKEPMRLLTQAIIGKQAEAARKLNASRTSGTRIAGWEQPIRLLEPEVIAFVAIKSLLVSTRKLQRVQHAATAIGFHMNWHVRWNEVRSQLKGENSPAHRAARRELVNASPRSLKKWEKILTDLTSDRWTKSLQFRVGTEVLACVRETLGGDVFVFENFNEAKFNGLTEISHIKMADSFKNLLKAKHNHIALNTPWFKPMLTEPADWSRHSNGRIYGGYHTNAPGFSELPMIPFVKTIFHPHTDDSLVPDAPEVFDAVNRVQRTPWRINTNVLARAATAIEHEVGPLPYEPQKDMPARISAETWAKMSKQDRGSWRNTKARIHDHNNRHEAKSKAARRCIETAKEMREHSAIYFPHNVDWRGRAYPLPQDLHPQADDFAKSLLRFAEAKPLGETGLQWLGFHMANCYGMDKLNRLGQADWINDNADNIFDVARDPFGDGLEFWSAADEPWQFLAAAIEYVYAWNWSTGPENYPSSLPVQVDGSCNGMQHLSALGLDPEGARSVNLVPGERQDIYQIVADKVNEEVLEHRQSGLDGTDFYPDHAAQARAWYGNVSRKTVKRGVMTTPYGLTPVGRRDQLLKDRMVEGIEGDDWENANYLSKLMGKAISETIVKGAEIMEWMQDIAANTTGAIYWDTPVGFKVRQHYVRMPGKRVNTSLGKFIFNTVETTDEDLEAHLSKQVLAIAPNYIHSMDAAHMMKTVNACPEEFSFSVVHDSFGCHAADMEVMSAITREQFVEMYDGQDYLTAFIEGVRVMYPDLDAKMTVKQPTQGDLDLKQVLESEFFFS